MGIVTGDSVDFLVIKVNGVLNAVVRVTNVNGVGGVVSVVNVNGIVGNVVGVGNVNGIVDSVIVIVADVGLTIGVAQLQDLATSSQTRLLHERS